MNAALRLEIAIFITGLTLLLLTGFFTGHILFWLVPGLAVYVAWNFYNLSRLIKWLSSPGKNIPQTTGVWGEIYHQLYNLYKRQRKAKRKLASIVTRFRESTQALPYATIVLNKDKEIEWFNNAAKKMFGLISSHDVGQRIDNLIRFPRFAEYINDEDFSKPLQVELKEQGILITITAYGKGEYLLGGHDVTQRRKLDEMRRNFIANASHELRTPLTVIAGYLEVSKETADEKMRIPLDRMQEQSDRMLTILEELMSLSKLEASDHIEDAEEINVAELIDEVYDQAISIDQGKHKIEKLVEPVKVSGNREELHTAISNLMTNAIRYSDENTMIKLYSVDKDSYVGIGVEDKGIGISYEHRHRLTERFYRVDSGRSREQGGTGLGLAIVKHILDRHHARLSIKSEPGKGSLFECQFPK
jgi:two-component system phosphate regulon sensor histidine kinase PhoR